MTALTVILKMLIYLKHLPSLFQL